MGAPLTESWEYSAGGDYRRRTFSSEEEGKAISGDLWYRQSYVIEQLDPVSNTWKIAPGNGGEHNEAQGYFWQGVNSSQYLTAVQDRSSGLLSNYDVARLDHPEAIGQSLVRPDLGGDQSSREKTFLYATPGALEHAGIVLTPQEIQQAQWQIANSTPAAQAARNGGHGLGIGGLILAAIAAAATWYAGGIGGAAVAGGEVAAEGMTLAEMAAYSAEAYAAAPAYGAAIEATAAGAVAGYGSADLGTGITGGNLFGSTAGNVAGYGAADLGSGLSTMQTLGLGSPQYVGLGSTAALGAQIATGSDLLSNLNTARQYVSSANTAKNLLTGSGAATGTASGLRSSSGVPGNAGYGAGLANFFGTTMPNAAGGSPGLVSVDNGTGATFDLTTVAFGFAAIVGILYAMKKAH